MIVMALGDTHGDRGFTKAALSWAAKNSVDKLVQVGDFGFWPRINNGQRFLHDVGKHSVELGVPLFFIDGNHEDHTYLQSLRERDDGSGFIAYGKYPITYITRGTRWEWDGVQFGAFGGAYSIDRAWRTENSPTYGWFDGEMPDPSRIESLGKVDVLFTHDSPVVPPYMRTAAFKTDPTSTLSQTTVMAALVATGAPLLIHGHWHVNNQYKVGETVVQGLDMNESSLYASAVVFDTATRRLYTVREWEYRDE